MADFKALSEDELVALCKDEIKGSIGYSDSDLSNEREKIMRYYHGELPKRQSNGNSSYVSQDVYDGVEGLKSLLLETFSAGNDVIHFTPQGPEDVETSRVCTAYTNYVLHRQNDGFSIMRDVMHDGLMSRVGIVKVYWEEKLDQIEEEFKDYTSEELDQALVDPSMELGKFTETDGRFSGTFIKSTNNSKVVIDVIPPEEFIINPMSKNIEDGFVAHRKSMRKTDLIKMGFDEDLIESIGSDEDPLGKNYDERYYRHEQIGPTSVNSDDHHRQEQMKEIVVYEAYIEADMEGEGISKLFKILIAGNTLLEYEEVDRRPFIVFTPIPVAHRFHGENFAYKLLPTQNARTVLMRSILDHSSVTTNPRYIVTKGSLLNPRELLDNRLGGIVNVTRADGVSPLPQNPLNPFIFQTVQKLEEDGENTSGISKLSQGLNKDAISNQNSQGMVEQLVNLSQQRSKIIARNFANNFLKPLFLEIYRLCIIHEDNQKIIDVAGAYAQVTPNEWHHRQDVEVAFKLGYGETEREAAKYNAIHAQLTQDPGLQANYGMKERYNMVRQSLLAQGIKDVDTYLIPPDKVPPPEPSAAEQMQQQIAMKQLEMEERKIAVQEQRLALDAEEAKFRMELELAKSQAEIANMNIEADRRDFDSETKADVAYEELKILKSQPQEQTTGIVSPNS